jgi:C4-dicarboxylate transporter
MICFLTDESCKKCGSNQLDIISVSEDISGKSSLESSEQQASSGYLKYFFYAVITELIALVLTFPAIAAGSMRHSGNAPVSGFEQLLGLAALALHFPTILLTFTLTILTDTLFVLVTPITQVIFLTYFFARLNRRKIIK